jgi:ABC-type nitrate/sulfonate/bicarbonate transport system substrate-binding protein
MSKTMAVVAVLAAMALAGAARAADNFVLQLHGPAQFQFAGYYAALWQGFYRDAGLTVEIKPGEIKPGDGKSGGERGEAALDPVREVTEGRAQFGTGTAELIVRIAQGQPLLLLAPIFQHSGAGMYYRADADFASPAALAKARVGRLPASDILDIELATALRAEGVDPDRLQPVPLQPGEAVAALADRNVEAVPGSAWEMPWRAHEKGFTVKSFNPAGYRVEFYGDTLFTLQRLAKAAPASVRAFRAASLKGWDYALTHPDEIAARMLSELPRPPGIADAGGFTRYQAELAVLLARHPTVALGHSNPDRWRRIETSMLRVGALLRTAEPEDFVYDPDAELRSRTDLRAFTILGATLVGGLAVTVLLWRGRRRRRPVAAVAAASASAAEEGTAATPASTAPALPDLPADLNVMLTRLDQPMRRLVPRQAAFRLTLLPELWRCRAEPQTVRLLVLDLIAAAAADLKGGGELVVGTRNYAFDAAAVAAVAGAELGEFARLTVRDSGAGLSEEALDRVFDPTTTARPAVATAARELRPLGGFVRVESAEGVGTAVHLYFPRVATPAAAAKPAQAAE